MELLKMFIGFSNIFRLMLMNKIYENDILHWFI